VVFGGSAAQKDLREREKAKKEIEEKEHLWSARHRCGF
jgi:hypothetical protein